MAELTLSEQTYEHLTHLWRGGSWAYIWTPDGPEYFSTKYNEMRREKPSRWFPLDRRWPPVPAAWAERNVYYGVHPSAGAGERWQRARIATIAAVNCVFAEFDTKDYGTEAAIWAHLETLPLFPTMIIRSGGGLHGYWYIEYPQLVTDDNRTYLRRCQGAWVDLTSGDDGAKDLARVLRLPGWQNRKPERGPDFPTVHIAEFEPRRLFPFYRITELVDERIAAIQAAERRRIAEDAARAVDVAPGAAEMLLDWAVRNAQTGSRHNMAIWLAGRLKAEGFDQWVASSIMKEFARRVSAAGSRQLEAGEMDKVTAYVWSAA